MVVLVFTASLLVLTFPARAADEAKASTDNPVLSVREIRAKLRARTDIAAEKVPLRDLINDLSKKHGVAIQLDEEGMRRDGGAPDVHVTADFKDITLRRILDELGLQHVVKDSGIVITRRQKRTFRVPAETQQQHVQALRPLLQAELSFLKRVCNPTDEQLRRLREEGDRHLPDAAAAYIIGFRREWFRAAEGGGIEIVESQADFRVAGEGFLVSTSSALDPWKVFRDGMAASAKAHVSPEQAERYREESEKREAGRKQAVIHCLVAELDQELILSAAQRDKLCESLSSNWNEQWRRYLQGGPMPLRLIPDQQIVPYLEDAQRVRLQALRSSSTYSAVTFPVADMPELGAFDIPVDGGRKGIVPEPEQ
jgi:hypothetical protein